ncbi:MAG: PPC domain-containing DNA-binding protein [Synechococcales bacterium]|nr:PPC domain-containing DNA-binding protein [Synechococcales bacterium]
MEVLPVRLTPGQDLRQRLKQIAAVSSIEAGFILSGIGSLRQAAVRFANQEAPMVQVGYFEIIAINGTLSQYGVHLHVAIANQHGQILGGHLCDGSIIHTTAEIVIGIVPGVVFRRSPDPQTGFLELEIGETVGESGKLGEN